MLRCQEHYLGRLFGSGSRSIGCRFDFGFALIHHFVPLNGLHPSGAHELNTVGARGVAFDRSPADLKMRSLLDAVPPFELVGAPSLLLGMTIWPFNRLIAGDGHHSPVINSHRINVKPSTRNTPKS